MQKFTHNGHDTTHVGLTALLKALHERLQEGIGVFGTDSRHVESGTEGRRTDFGNAGFAMKRRTGAMLTRIETGKSDQLLRRVKGSNMRDFSQEFGGSEIGNAFNRGQQVALVFQVGVTINMVVDFVLEGFDLGIEKGDMGTDTI